MAVGPRFCLSGRTALACRLRPWWCAGLRSLAGGPSSHPVFRCPSYSALPQRLCAIFYRCPYSVRLRTGTEDAGRKSSQVVCGVLSVQSRLQRQSGGAITSRQAFFTSDSQDNRFEKENILTVPNLISLSRIALSPVLGYLVLSENYTLACGLFVLAGISDVVDGYIARRYPGQSSMLGTALDPLADKVLILVLCVALTMRGLIPVPLTVLILARDAVLIAGSFFLRYVTLPPPRTWSRYWDIQRSTVQVMPSMLSKANTGLQLLLVGLTVGAPLVGAVGHPLLQGLWYVTGFTTVASGLSYITNLGGFRVLRKR